MYPPQNAALLFPAVGSHTSTTHDPNWVDGFMVYGLPL